MTARLGSWPPLLAASLVFLLFFVWQRGHSTVLQMEGQRAQAQELARAAQTTAPGVSVADVLALRDLVGVTAAFADWARVTEDFAARLRAARRDPQALEDEVLVAIRAIVADEVAVRRFLVLRDRFAAAS